VLPIEFLKFVFVHGVKLNLAQTRLRTPDPVGLGL
jgi:hypothetical protein